MFFRDKVTTYEDCDGCELFKIKDKVFGWGREEGPGGWDGGGR